MPERRRKRKRIVGSLLAALLCLVVVVVLVVHFCAAPVIHRALTKVMTEMAGTEVTIGSLEFSPFIGRCEVRSVQIANPDGYKTPHAIRIDCIALAFSPKSYVSERKIIRYIHLDGIDVNSEGQREESNLMRLQEAMMAYEKKHPKKKGVLQIDHFRLTNMTIHVKDVLGEGQDWDLNPEPIDLKDLGSHDGDEDAGEVVGLAIGNAIDEEVTNSGLRAKRMEMIINDGVDKITSGAAGLFGKVKSTFFGDGSDEQDENDGDELPEGVDE